MKNIKYKINGLLIVLFMFAFAVFTNKTYAQINENNASNADVIDTLSEDEENMFDTTANYQQLYDNLNGSGDWIQVTKGAITSEMMDQSNDDISYSEEPLDSEDASQVIYVWRPYVTGSYWDWDPYCYGRWEFTYAGWIWISYYDWGWAPYHYGRWWYSGYYGWIWFPGRVWGPNWVCWRHNNGYVGWHPRAPRIWWRNRHGIVFKNHTFKSRPEHWTFVEKKNFTKDIDNNTKLNSKKNYEVIKNTNNISSVNSFNEKNKKYSYKGPSINSISNVSGESIVPKKLKTITSREKNTVSENTVFTYKNNKLFSSKNNVQTKPVKYIDGNEITKKTNNNESTKNSENINLKNSSQNKKQEFAVNNNVNTTKKSPTLYSNSEFYKIQAKPQVKPQNNANKVGNNNQRVNTNINKTNKTGNNNQQIPNNNTRKSGNYNTQKPPSNNTGKTPNGQQKAKLHSNNNNQYTPKTTYKSSNNNNQYTPKTTYKSSNNNNTRQYNSNHQQNSSRNYGNKNNGSTRNSSNSNNSSRSGRGGHH